jgi:hypothetical protein
MEEPTSSKAIAEVFEWAAQNPNATGEDYANWLLEPLLGKEFWKKPIATIEKTEND